MIETFDYVSMKIQIINMAATIKEQPGKKS